MQISKLKRAVRVLVFLAGPLLAAVQLAALAATQPAPVVAGCQMFPADHILNVPIDTLPVDANSAAYINTIGSTTGLHADFGSGTWDGFPIGIPYTDVPGTTPRSSVVFDYGDESDPGPYPIPANPPIEGDPNGDGDRHILIVDRDDCVLYELYAAHHETDGWYAGSGAIFDLNSYALRPAGWTSADAAGLPVLPGLVRYDEIASGSINHAIRFTVSRTRRAYVWPARHYASSLTGTQYPPMGQRFRLKAGFDISGFSPDVQVILQAMKTYGLILADNGSNWYISGAPDERWDNDVLQEMRQVHGSDFEAVDVSSLMLDPNSGQAQTSAAPPVPMLSSPSSGSTTTDSTPDFAWAAAAGAAQYQIQIDNNADFSSPVVDAVVTAPPYTPATALATGAYSWRVRAGNGTWSGYSSPWTLTVNTLLPAPALLAPPSGSTTADLTPVFDWADVAGATRYRIQVDNDADFSSTVISTTLTASTYTAGTALSNGTYYWRVQTRNALGTYGQWSASWTLAISGQLLPAPVLLAPPSGSTTADLTPVFDWADVAGATRYRIQVDNNADFSSPVLSTTPTASTYTVGTALSNGTYYWRVQARDALGTYGQWSTSWTLVLSSP